MTDTSTMMNGNETDLFVDNQPMNDEELSRLHESTLQMFRSNKIGPKNAFDIVLIDYLPAIFEATSFDDDHMNNFQSVGTTLETSAKIYAARIDSLYSETRKAQSILRSNNENFQRSLDDDDQNEENGGDSSDEINAERRISNNKRIRLMMKRKKSIVTDRQKLLRKNRMDDIRPIMMNQFFLSAMHNDSMMLSELYEKINLSCDKMNKKTFVKSEATDLLSTSLQSNEFIGETLFIDTTNSSAISTDLDLSPSSDLTNNNRTTLLLTPNSLITSSNSNLNGTSIRSRTNSLISNSSILTNAANLLTDTPNEYAHLDSSKVHAFINEIQTCSSADELVSSPSKLNRKRRFSIEYPFPFMVEQAKKQRLTPKKLREQILLDPNSSIHLRPPSPEYIFQSDESSRDSTSIISIDFNEINLNESIVSNSISKRQRAIDFRHLQSKMHQTMMKNTESDDHVSFSELLQQMNVFDEHHQISSSDIGIYFSALLNNAVRHQLSLNTNELRDDFDIFRSRKK